ncbi:MAG: PucC family protein [Comamonadaceae bacterium]|nr:PucC family protein [Comamonadaceae bacterium]
MGTIVSALALRRAAAATSRRGRLVQVIQGAARGDAGAQRAWRCGSRSRVTRGAARKPQRQPTRRASPWPGATYIAGRRRAPPPAGDRPGHRWPSRMQDVLLEPYGGQILGMGVGDTTWLTATLAARRAVRLQRWRRRMPGARHRSVRAWRCWGALVGVPAFVLR